MFVYCKITIAKYRIVLFLILNLCLSLDSGQVGDGTVGIRCLKKLKKILFFPLSTRVSKQIGLRTAKDATGIVVSSLLCNFKLKSTTPSYRTFTFTVTISQKSINWLLYHLSYLTIGDAGFTVPV
jgi:hypothetical protein